MKIIAGDAALAFLNNSLTLAAHIHTNISINSDQEAEKNGTPASPATALANKVFPEPGGPNNNTPLGIFAHSFKYFLLSFKKSTISISSSFTSSIPATSANFVSTSVPVLRIHVLVPKGRPPAPHHLHINLNRSKSNQMRKRIGRSCSISSLVRKLVSSLTTLIGVDHVRVSQRSVNEVSRGLLVSQIL